MFLTFEGVDGAGKTTQVGLLQTALEAHGYTVTRTREPGGDVVGEKVRELVLTTMIGSEAELLLFAAARAQNVADVIRPALAEGHVVLCDRYVDSTVAYQGYGRRLSLPLIRAVNHFATGGLLPTCTILLDLPAAEGLARRRAAREGQNRLDNEALAFYERVRRGFQACAMKSLERIITIDATRPADDIAQEVLDHVLALLSI